VKTSGPGTLKTLVLLARLTLRQFVNRSLGGFRVFSRKSKRRKARPLRLLIAVPLTLLFTAFFIFQGIQISSMALYGLAGRFRVLSATGDDVFIISMNGLGNLYSLSEGGIESYYYPESADRPSADPLRDVLRKEAEMRLFPTRFGIEERRVRKTDLDEADARAVEELTDRMAAAYKEHGVEAFRMALRKRLHPFPSTAFWPAGVSREMTRASAILMTMAFAGLAAMTLGYFNKDLGKVEWDLVWLSTFPVKRRSLFPAKLLNYAFANPFAWIVNSALLFTVFWSSGKGWHALWMALVGALCLNLIIASLVMAIEVLLQCYFSARRAKAFQALMVALGMPGFFLLMATGMSIIVQEWVVKATAFVGGAVVYLPWTLPAAATRSGAAGAAAFAALPVVSCLTAVAAALVAERFTANGLLRQSTVYQARKSSRRGLPASPLGGIIAKDLRYLIRDRAFAARVLLMPLVLVAFQVMVNPAILSSGFADARRVSVVIFGVCAFLLFTGGMHALNLELRSLWLLYTFPVRLVDVMKKKAMMWASMAAVYCVVLMIVYVVQSDTAPGAFLPPAISALAGVFPVSFVVVGLGAIGTDPDSDDSRPKMSAWMVYLLLVGLYVPVILVSVIWLKVIIYGLYCLIPVAMWSVAAARLPYFLDQS
jgi:hypothetical protein